MRTVLCDRVVHRRREEPKGVKKLRRAKGKTLQSRDSLTFSARSGYLCAASSRNRWYCAIASE